ncbi:hypothetical protein NLI96_g6926 [Meripilus lineatus]|uniref:Uncharacterized protein n=1 Tax=Meripilus lineatus TaxID=2056292 RepID=A0AAD5V004_9APHY|nr:hypothetical protein NLI96_g6926 [Physisporinus lineatus]
MPSSACLFKYLSVALAIVAPVLGATPTVTTRSEGISSLFPVGGPVKSLTDPAVLARAPAPQTNAERLRRGLSPFKPRSFTRNSLHARTSATPCTPHTGVIKITYDGFEGYVPKDVTVLGLYASTSVVADALSVTFCSPSDIDEAFDITTLNGPLPTFPFLGLVPRFGDDISLLPHPGSWNYLHFTATGQSPDLIQGDSAFSVAISSTEKFRSTIWKLNPTTNELAIKWVDPNSGNTVDIAIFLIIGEYNALSATGDLALFNSHWGTDFPQVTLTFQENAPVGPGAE